MRSTLLQDPVLRRQFAMYALIGGTVFCIDFSTFQLGLKHGVPLTAATTLAYFTGTTAHFLLNRYANFRRFERAIHDQARTFAVIIFLQWLVTLGVVTLLVGRGALPLAARIAAIAVTLPLGFLANRYLTFGVGIIPRMKSALKPSK